MPYIDTIIARSLDLPLREPFETAQRRTISSPTVIIELHTADITGFGEATPVRYVTGEDIDSVIYDINIAAEALQGMKLSEYRLASYKLAEVLPHSKSARAGIEMAILDALAKSLGIPLYAYLGGSALSIETDVTIPIVPPEHAKEKAAQMNAQGFNKFKVKVGKDEEEDIARVLAINAGAPGCSFVLDANQGFKPEQAVRFVNKLLDEGMKIKLLEQPVDALDLDGLRYVTEHTEAPVFADEAAQTPEDVLQIARHQAANGVNVKLQKAGMVGALEIVSICRAAGLDLMFGCMLESKVGQSAAAHIACGTHAFSVFDLDSDLLLADQPIEGGVKRRGSVLEVTEQPGLGCRLIS